MRDQWAGPALGRGAEHQSGDILAFLQQFGDRLDRVALADGDRGGEAGFLDDRARGLDDHRLGPQLRFLLHRRLDAAPLDKFLRRDQRQQLDDAAGTRRAPGRVAQGRARFLAFVHDDEIRAHEPLLLEETVRQNRPSRNPGRRVRRCSAEDRP